METVFLVRTVDQPENSGIKISVQAENEDIANEILGTFYPAYLNTDLFVIETL